MPKNSSAKRMTRTVLASTLGISLVIGGSTYALWSTVASSNTAAAITTGDLQVTALSPQKWFDVTKADAPVEIVSLDDYRMAPGDSIRLTQTLNTIIVGDNMSGVLQVLVPNETLSEPLMTQAKLTLALFDKDGVEIGSVTPTTNTADSLTLEVEDLARSSATGDAYTIQLTVALPAATTNSAKVQVASLADMLINLKQGKAISEPIVFLAEPDLGQLTLGGASSRIALAESSPKDPTTLTLESGALPKGMAISGVELVGTPTQIGTFKFDVKAKNSTRSDVRSFTLNTNLTAVEGWNSVTVDGASQKFNNAQVSSDGTKMVTSSADGAFVSYNGGMTWTKLYSGSNGKVLMSATGNKILLTGKPNSLLTKVPSDESYSTLTMTKTAPATIQTFALSEAGTGLAVGGSTFLDTNYREFEWNSFTGNTTGATRISAGGERFVIDSTGTNRVGFGAGGFGGYTGSWAKPSGLGTTVSSISSDGKIVITGENGSIYVGTAVKHPSGTFLNPSATLKATGKGVWQDIKILNNGTLIGLQDGKVKKSSDSGVTWTDITPVTMPILAMNIPSSAGGKIMLTVNGGTENYILQGTV